MLRDGLCLKERVLSHCGLLHDEERRFGGHNLHCGAHSLCRSYERRLRFDLMDVTLRADAIHRGAGKFMPAVIAHLCNHAATTSCWLTEVSFLLSKVCSFVAHSVKSLKPMLLWFSVTWALDPGCTVKEWAHTHDAAFRNEGPTSDSCHCGA